MSDTVATGDEAPATMRALVVARTGGLALPRETIGALPPS